jgi:lipase ATG15
MKPTHLSKHILLAPKSFKFFTSPSLPGFGIVAIRGSQTMFDWLNNLKLYAGAGLAQLVKWLTPYGWIWTPILEDLVRFMSFFQTEDLEAANYYKVTTEFLNEYKAKNYSLTITGASLGGGMAQISGAQAHTPAIAISGMGATLIRNIVKPKISIDDINKYVFNFIPDRDVIARLGGRPRLHQEADCNAPVSKSFSGCHGMFRSFCEISYRCGTNGRPVFCDCHYKYGYPEPEPIGTPTRSFREACLEQEQAFLDATGSTTRTSWS